MFRDRLEAGQQLASALSRLQLDDPVVLALPRGGVVVAAEVARRLMAPLDLVIPRKIGHPLSAEYAIGAVTENGEPVWNETEAAQIDPAWLEQQVKIARREAKRRRLDYLGKRESVNITGKTAIVVDDGIATGLTIVAALKDLRRQQPRKVIVAVPVAPADLPEKITNSVDRVIALEQPEFFGAVGAFYREFEQVSDDEVKSLLSKII